MMYFGPPNQDMVGSPMAAPEIPVTPEMVEAGLQELGEHRLNDDLRDVLEDVYRAMAHADRARASSTSADR
jgi:hypothetical protein